MADLALDPTVVEEQVRRLNRQADSLGLLGVILGAPVGAVVGGLPLVAHGPIPSKFGIATMLLGALLAGTLGYILARGRSFGYRLKAQLMLGQLRLEQNVEALLAVSEHPAVPALPAAEPVHALPEAPRIEELVDAGLAMPTAAPVVEYTPPAAPEEIAPLPEPEPEPLTVPEPIQLPSWAADLEHALAAAVPTLTSPAPAPAPGPEPEAAPAWTLPVREEPAPVPSLPTPADPHEIASVPTPVPVPTPEPVTAPAWTMPPAEQVQPAPVAQPDLSTMSIAEIARLGEPQEIAPAPTPVPVPMPAPAPLPAWVVPAAEHEQEEPEAAPPAPEPATPATPRDLSTMSIAEIARLADAGAL